MSAPFLFQQSHPPDMGAFVLYDYNGTGAQKWVLSKGSIKVEVAGTNYCLDAESGTFLLCLEI